MKTLFLSLSCLFLSVASGFSWGEEGHRAVATVAFKRLNATAQAAVSQIMSNSPVPELKSVASAATWPDDIRTGKRPGKLVRINDAAAAVFNKRFPTNNVWHFSNYPLGGVYAENGPFSSPEDVAHVIGYCIEALEGSAKGKWAALRKDEALAWLIHLVGDIHQPLHVAEGYYSFEGKNAFLVTDPKEAMQNKANDDAGGSQLYYSATDNFHALWDKGMVNYLSPDEDQIVDEISTVITSGISTGNLGNSGDYHKWANRWATQSIKSAREAYKALVPGEDNFIGKRSADHAGAIDINLNPKDYKEDYSYLIRQQLARASYNLADLLNNIQWQP